MIILPILEMLFYTEYITPIFLLLFVFGLIFTLIGFARR